mmetsp:Transcript_27762/g.84745  ORF Transcript_27762/g.84745 Transcript_27762/m.84745 type:complete len:149 (+) Transcript_27762:178-624(+)
MADSRVPCSNDAAGKKAAVGVMGGKHATHESCIQSEAWHLSRRDWDIYHHTHSRTNIASLEPRSIPFLDPIFLDPQIVHAVHQPSKRRATSGNSFHHLNMRMSPFFTTLRRAGWLSGKKVRSASSISAPLGDALDGLVATARCTDLHR